MVRVALPGVQTGRDQRLGLFGEIRRRRVALDRFSPNIARQKGASVAQPGRLGGR